LRTYLRGALWTAALLFVVLLSAGALWLVLARAGDAAGSQGAKGVALVSVLCLLLDFAALVVLLAIAEITRPPAGPRPPRALLAEPQTREAGAE
jgi:hypothetical protein